MPFDVHAFQAAGEEVWGGVPPSGLSAAIDPLLFASFPASHGAHGK